MTRSQGIAAKCRECTYDPRASGTWREQVAICSCPDCPLWRYRPLPRKPAIWVTRRDSKVLPEGFVGLDHEAALDCLRGNVNARSDSAPVFHASLDTERRGATPLAVGACCRAKELP